MIELLVWSKKDGQIVSTFNLNLELKNLCTNMGYDWPDHEIPFLIKAFKSCIMSEEQNTLSKSEIL